MFTLFQWFGVGRRWQFPPTKESFERFFWGVLICAAAWFLFAVYRSWRNKERSDWKDDGEH